MLNERSVFRPPFRRSIGTRDISDPTTGGGVPDRPYPIYTENVLADLSRVAKINNGGSLNVADVTSDGVDAVRFTPPTTDQRLAPVAVLSTPVSVGAKDSIVLDVLPYANADVSSPAPARHQLELFSGASVSQTTNYHTTSASIEPTDFRGQTTSPAAATPGRRGKYSVALPNFAVIGTGATLSAITGARHLGRGPALANQSHDIFRILHRPNPAAKAKVIFAFDDLTPDQYTTAYPLMLAAGFPMTMYGGAYKKVADGDGSVVSLAQLKEMRNVTGGSQKGQVAGQAWIDENPGARGLNVAQLKTELGVMLAWGRANGFEDDMLDGSFFSSVDQRSALSSAFTDGMFRTVRTFSTGNATTSPPPLPYGETWPIGDPLKVRAVSAAHRSSAELTAQVDQAVACNGLVVLVWHGAAYINGFATLAPMIALAQSYSATVEVTTMRGALFGA